MKFTRIVICVKDFEKWFGVCAKTAQNLMQDYRAKSNLDDKQPLTIFHVYEQFGVKLEHAPLLMN